MSPVNEQSSVEAFKQLDLDYLEVPCCLYCSFGMSVKQRCNRMHGPVS